MTVLVSTTFRVLADSCLVFVDAAPASYDVTRLGHAVMLREVCDRGYAVDRTGSGLMVIRTARPLDVPVTIEVHDEPPVVDPGDYDGVVDTGLDLRTGRVGAYGYMDSHPDTVVDVPSGTYRVRICFEGLFRVSDDGLEGDDHYRLFFWPTERPGDLGDRGPHVVTPPPEHWGG